jgi:hypothetical protein
MKLIHARGKAARQLRFEDFHGVNDLGDQAPQQVLPIQAGSDGLGRPASEGASANCRTVITASRQGASAGCPCVGNRSAKASSVYRLPHSWRNRR